MKDFCLARTRRNYKTLKENPAPLFVGRGDLANVDRPR